MFPKSYNGRQKCVILSSYLWFSKDCAAKYYPLCKMAAASSKENFTTAYPPATPAILPCHHANPDDNWILDPKDPKQEYCYYFSDMTDQKNFIDASDACKKMGGRIASIHDERENNFIVGNTDRDTRWIGMNEMFSGDWEWTDKSDVNYFRWNPGGEHFS